MMTALWAVPGAVVLVLLAFDVTSTVLSPASGPGPVTRAIGRVAWHGIGSRIGSPASRWWLVLGPGVLLGTVLGWLVLLLAGWWLLALAAGPVVETATRAPATALERLYMVVSAVSTLGLGDVVPTSTGGRIVVVGAALTGLGTVTLAVTYALPVLTAVTDRRILATTISAAGTDVSSLAQALAEPRGTEQFLAAVTGSVHALAQRHRAYPILHFFHSTDRVAALAPSLAALDEAVVVARSDAGQQAVPMLTRQRLRAAVDDLLDVTKPHLQRHLATTLVPDRSAEDVAEPLGCRHDPDEHRRRLHALVVDDGWSWDVDVLGRGRPRAPSG